MGFWLTVFAALLALLITAIVVSANAYSLRKLRDNQILASVVPAAGALRGLRALDGSEWIPSEDPKHMLVLFGLPDFDQQGGYDFWRDVAARSGSVSPGLQFVGLCIASIRCNQSARDGSALTILTAMDPLQTHALAVGARQGRASLYFGSQVQGSFTIREGQQALVAQLVEIATKRDKKGDIK